MAHFLGFLKGSRGEATRLGTKASGLRAVAASWEGAVEGYLTYDSIIGQDVAHVSLIPWRGAGTTRVLYDGPVSGQEKKAASDSDNTAALYVVFGAEWALLSMQEASAILPDFAELVEEFEGAAHDAAREYRNRIGGGNLRSYAQTMQAKARVEAGQR